MDGEAPPKKGKPGAPLWLATFADLMSLLMCFFVLLLSFSEMDIRKYKQVAGSMAKAFGVQKEVVVTDTPLGSSFVATEFSPGRPNNVADKTMMQEASQMRPTLDAKAKASAQSRLALEKLKAALRTEIRQGKVSVEMEGERVVIRLQEKDSFPSGSDRLMQDIRPVLAKVGEQLTELPGRVIVAGHTDNVPIRGGRFRSNWDLSSARAVTVVESLLTTVDLPSDRLEVEGRGEFDPLVPNDSAANRALNRRVEIILEQTPQEAASAADRLPEGGAEAER